MARIDIDLQKYDGEFKKAGMDRLVKAAEAIRDAARGFVPTGTVTRVPGRRRKVRNHRLVPDEAPPIWMERTPGAMKKTLRTVRKKGFENVESLDAGSGTFWTENNDVRVYAGTFKTWWAIQMEKGRGKWKAAPVAFMEKGIAASSEKVRSIIENGE